MEEINIKEKEENLTVEQKFGMTIRYYRQIAGISQEELSFRSGLHRNYVSDTERGRRNVSLKAIERFAKGLNISITDLFSRM
ncbi:MAG: helix-turn-helix transcriptional regulator [Erysipelotrichaceae bacterium]|nr:helix-turn-helix transcriptional regulator [Erysipelotrichaceae bacterium]